jgi:hypothetical protein
MSTFKLGRGEYERPAEANYGEKDSRLVSQLLFFAAAISLHPESLPSLFELSLRLPETMPRPWDNPEELSGILDIIRQDVTTWCSEFGVIDAWFVQFAIMFAYVGRYLSVSQDSTIFFTGLDPLIDDATTARRSLSEVHFVVDFGSWDVLLNNRQEFASHAREAFEQELSRYLDMRAEEAKSANLKKTPEKRIADTYFWLAGYQVCGWSAAKIADAENRVRRAVEKQITALASEIGLTRRTNADYDRVLDSSQIHQQLIQAQRSIREMNLDIAQISSTLARILPPALRAPFG